MKNKKSKKKIALLLSFTGVFFTAVAGIVTVSSTRLQNILLSPEIQTEESVSMDDLHQVCENDMPDNGLRKIFGTVFENKTCAVPASSLLSLHSVSPKEHPVVDKHINPLSPTNTNDSATGSALPFRQGTSNKQVQTKNSNTRQSSSIKLAKQSRSVNPSHNVQVAPIDISNLSFSENALNNSQGSTTKTEDDTESNLLSPSRGTLIVQSIESTDSNTLQPAYFESQQSNFVENAPLDNAVIFPSPNDLLITHADLKGNDIFSSDELSETKVNQGNSPRILTFEEDFAIDIGDNLQVATPFTVTQSTSGEDLIGQKVENLPITGNILNELNNTNESNDIANLPKSLIQPKLGIDWLEETTEKSLGLFLGGSDTNVSKVPEPSSIGVVSLCLILLGFSRYRKKIIQSKNQ